MGVVMKKIALLIAVAALSSALVAQTTTPAPSGDSTKQPSGDSTKSKTTPTAKKASTLSGSVTSIDTTNKTIILKVGNNDDTLTVDSTTVIKPAEKIGKLSDLSSGSKVTATYKTTGGKKVATKITEKAAAPVK
jgi:hypothetical protein